jgi:ornithine cyclodeaminase/alanine dehydrogenase-like protein (mu-crystallin family)
MRDVFCEVSSGTVVMPLRSVVKVENPSGAMLFMPGYIPPRGGIGVKIVSVFPENAGKNLPTISALIILSSPDTGQALAIIDGGYVTALRTGATSGLATDLLARQDAHTLGVFGAGVQARTQIAAILEVRKIGEVIVYAPDMRRTSEFISALRTEYGNRVLFTIAESRQQLVRGSDIIVTATTSDTPVFDGRDLREGTHINAIGSFTPQAREVDDDTVRESRIYVDALDACLHEAGDLLIPMKQGVISRDDIRGELGELALGSEAGRESDRDITLFKSVGLSVQDVIVAQQIHAKAVDQRMGQVIES